MLISNYYPSTWVDLDHVPNVKKSPMPRVDGYDQFREVRSIKSMDLEAPTYVNHPTEIYNTIYTNYFSKLRDYPEATLKHELRKRKQIVPDDLILKRRLDVVIPENVSVTSIQGYQLKRAYCKPLVDSFASTVLPTIEILVDHGSFGFRQWDGMLDNGRPVTRQACLKFFNEFYP